MCNALGLSVSNEVEEWLLIWLLLRLTTPDWNGDNEQKIELMARWQQRDLKDITFCQLIQNITAFHRKLLCFKIAIGNFSARPLKL